MKKLKEMNEKEKKWFLIRLIGGISFLLAGAIFGIVSLSLSGWSFVEFVTNPTTDLIILCLIAFGVVTLSSSKVK